MLLLVASDSRTRAISFSSDRCCCILGRSGKPDVREEVGVCAAKGCDWVGEPKLTERLNSDFAAPRSYSCMRVSTRARRRRTLCSSAARSSAIVAGSKTGSSHSAWLSVETAGIREGRTAFVDSLAFYAAFTRLFLVAA